MSEEVADGRIVPAHNNRMRFRLRGGHFSTLLEKGLFWSNYFRGWKLFVAHLSFHNFRHLIVWLFAADPWDPIFWRGLGVVDCPTQLMCTWVFICSVPWQSLKNTAGTFEGDWGRSPMTEIIVLQQSWKMLSFLLVWNHCLVFFKSQILQRKMFSERTNMQIKIFTGKYILS